MSGLGVDFVEKIDETHKGSRPSVSQCYLPGQSELSMR